MEYSNLLHTREKDFIVKEVTGKIVDGLMGSALEA